MSTQEQKSAATAKRIRRKARRQSLKPHCHTLHIFEVDKRLWWFGDQNGKLKSPDFGLPDEDAERWLQSKNIHN